MIIHKSHGLAWLSSVLMILAPAAYALAQSGAGVDCSTIVKDRRDDSADPKDIQNCILRGADPPINSRINRGKSGGTKTGGSGGFAYGTVAAPEMSPGALNANATVSEDAIKASCTFPPKINLSGARV